MTRKRFSLLLLCLCLVPVCTAGLCEETEDEIEYTLITDSGEEFLEADYAEAAAVSDEEPFSLTARDDFINRIISLGKELYVKADGKAQRAHYKGDIYVCKNFTTYLFNQNKADFCMEEYPNVKLVIPNSLPADKCKPYAYGFLWQNIEASKGNPFIVAAQFRYDSELSAEENMAKAIDFMKEVRRGDFFQMSANYEYGVGAHSAIMISDYDPAAGTVHWMDSNMRGGKRNGIRYGIVQYDEEKSIEWWASCFCHKKRGATLYRLRDDIIYREKQ